MAVYVDGLDFLDRAGRAWCHMVADTVEELDAFAGRLGLRREWRQRPVPHYDLTGPLREEAIRLGAITTTSFEILAIGQRARFVAFVIRLQAALAEARRAGINIDVGIPQPLLTASMAAQEAEAGTVTVVYAGEADRPAAERVAALWREEYPHASVHVVHGEAQ